MSYEPTKGPLPGVQWEPSNGTEGHSFLSQWCGNCQRDKAFREGVEIEDCDDSEKCEIIGASFRSEAIEWRQLEDGKCMCTAFVEAGKDIPPERCDKTPDLFRDKP